MDATMKLIYAVITALIPVLIPAIVHAVFTAQKARLEKLKLTSERNKDLIRALIITAQATYKTVSVYDKYRWVITKASQKIKIPEEDLNALIESTLAELQKEFKEKWEKL